MAIEMISKTLGEYLDGLVPPRPARMVQMEEHAARIRFPIIGPACGHLCYQVARMTGATRIFEMGSGLSRRA